MSLELSTAPTVEPVDVEEMKDHLRIDHSDDDVLLGQYIRAARLFAETKLSRTLCTSTWKLRLDAFPCWEIEVPRPPLVSVTTLAYIDTGGTSQTLTENTHFVKDIYSEPGRITPAYNQVWPATRSIVNAVTLTYVAGYGDPDDVPESIRYGIKLLVAEMYDKREPTAANAVQLVPGINHLLMSESWGRYA